VNVRLVEAGLVTGRAIFTEVDPVNRRIHIAIVPGHVEALTKQGEALPDRIWPALPLTEGDWRKLPDSELVVAKAIGCPPQLGCRQPRLHFIVTLPLGTPSIAP